MKENGGAQRQEVVCRGAKKNDGGIKGKRMIKKTLEQKIKNI